MWYVVCTLKKKIKKKYEIYLNCCREAHVHTYMHYEVQVTTGVLYILVRLHGTGKPFVPGTV